MPQLPRLSALHHQRLIWKIFLGFALTFILIMQGLWAYFILVGKDRPPLENYHREAAAPALLNSLAWVLAHQGVDGVPSLLAQWPQADRQGITLQPVSAPLPTQDRFTDLVVTTVQGDQIRIVYSLPQRPFERNRKRVPWDIPHEILIMGMIGGLLFAAALTWYLARPIHILRRGFARLAAGDFSVRLRATMGRRRDELADLAQSFDLMASRLEGLVKAREQLLHDVSHELRSPLARLHMAVGLARQSPHKTAASLDRIEAEGQRLDDLVGELLSLSRVEAGVHDSDSYFDAFALVNSVIADAQYEAQASGVEVKGCGITQNEDGPTLRGNPRLIRRALENVVRNALRFSPTGSTVQISAALVRDENDFSALEISISDSGPGVSPEDLTRIFDPFVRGAQTQANTGFGLGLSIARRTVEAHGGVIRAENRPSAGDAQETSGGLMVTVRLPL